MRNSPRHGSRGPRRHRNAEGRGHGPGRRHHRYPEGRGQGPPAQAGKHRRKRRLEGRGHPDHQSPRGRRRNRRRSPQEGFRPHHRKRGKPIWHPSIEIVVFEDRFEVLVELPGVSQDSVNVSVTDKLLIVKGKKQRKQTDEKKIVRRSELRYGRFKRVLPLPPHAKTDEIKAEFRDGLLTVVVPKTEEAKATEIPINVDA